MEAIKIFVWTTKRSSNPEIVMVDDSAVPLMGIFCDLPLSPADTVIVYAQTNDGLHQAECTIRGDCAIFTPEPGFFRPGVNKLQFEVNQKIITHSVQIFCAERVSKGV